jgi:glycosyltransferase involved in cell wall biosynthesis
MIVASQEDEIPVHEDGILVIVNQPRQIVMEAWRRCLFGVVPSIWLDPCPTVALEAMAAEKAIIASSIGGLKEIVLENETGLLIPPGNVKALANAMLFLVDNPEVTIEFGNRGYDRLLKCFSSDIALENYETILRELVLKTRSSSL